MVGDELREVGDASVVRVAGYGGVGGGCGRGWDVHGDRDGLGAIGAEIGGGGRCGDGDTSETSARARGVGADEEGGQQAKLGGDCGEGADGQAAGETRQ